MTQEQVPIIVPKLGLSMEEALVLHWNVEVGEVVEKGDALLEIETDKATYQVSSPASGTLISATAVAGTVVLATAIVGWIRVA